MPIERELPAAVDSCPGARSRVVVTPARDAFAAFNPDGSFVMGLSYEETVTQRLPTSCLGGATCEALAEGLGCVAEPGACVCTMVLPLTSWRLGTYREAEDGLELTTDDAFGQEVLTAQRCVSGEDLSLAWTDSDGRARRSIFTRGITEAPESYALHHVLDLAPGALTVAFDDETPRALAQGEVDAGTRRPAGTGVVTWTSDGAQGERSITSNAGRATTVVVHAGAGGVVATQLARPAATDDGELRVYNAHTHPITIDQAGVRQVVAPASTSEPLMRAGVFLAELGVDADGDGVIDARYAASVGGSGVVFVATAERPGDLAILDDGASYERLADAAVAPTVRVVHAAPASPEVVAFELGVRGVSVARYEVGEPVRLWPGARVVRALGAEASLTLAEGDVVLLALVDGPSGPELRRFDAAPPGPASARFIAAMPDAARVSVHAGEAALVSDLAFGASATVAVDVHLPTMVVGVDGVRRDDAQLIHADAIAGPIDVFVLAGPELLVVDGDATERVQPVPPPPARLLLAHLAPGLGRVRLELEVDGAPVFTEATFGADAPALTVPPGAYTLTLVASDGGAPVARVAVTLGEREIRHVVLHGAAAPQVTLVSPTAGEGEVGLVALAPERPTLHAALLDGAPPGGLASVVVAYGETATVSGALGGTWTLGVDADGDHTIDHEVTMSGSSRQLFAYLEVDGAPVVYALLPSGSLEANVPLAAGQVPVRVVNTGERAVDLVVIGPSGEDLPRVAGLAPLHVTDTLALPLGGARLAAIDRDGARGDIGLTLVAADPVLVSVDDAGAAPVLSAFADDGPGWLHVPRAGSPDEAGRLFWLAVSTTVAGDTPAALTAPTPPGDLAPLDRRFTLGPVTLGLGDALGPRWTYTVADPSALDDVLVMNDRATPPTLYLLRRDGARQALAPEAKALVRVLAMQHEAAVTEVLLDGAPTPAALGGYALVPAGAHTIRLAPLGTEVLVDLGSARVHTLLPSGPAGGAAFALYDHAAIAPEGQAIVLVNQDTMRLDLLAERSAGDGFDAFATALAQGESVVYVPLWGTLVLAVDRGGDGTIDSWSDTPIGAPGELTFCVLGADALACHGHDEAQRLPLMPYVR